MAKTLAELEPLIIQWAEAKGLIKHTVEQALAQHGKTEEEVGELLEAIKDFKAVEPAKDILAPVDWELDMSISLHQIRLEAGDVIMTLIIQSAIHKTTFCACRVWGYNSVTNQSIAEDCEELGFTINRSELNSYHLVVRHLIALLSKHVEIAIAPYGLTLEDCLEEAWGQMCDRKGQTIDGVIVKDNL